MSLSNINFKNYYSGSMGHNLLDLLYTPCLKNSIKYDRVAGFFSPKVLSAAAEGMASFVQNGGKYRLVFSKHLFKEEDYESYICIEIAHNVNNQIGKMWKTINSTSKAPRKKKRHADSPETRGTQATKKLSQNEYSL